MAGPSEVEALSPADEPVVDRGGVERVSRPPAAGVALCLSGGGYRAMLFHVGALVRIKELGILPKVSWVSSVSGGSITAGVLGMNWKHLDLATTATADLEEHLVKPIRKIAGQTVDTAAIGWGIFSTGTISDQVAGYYDTYLFGGATLQSLPDQPRFLINATNVKTGALWRFSKAYMADYRVGLIERPETPLAVAVAASSAFPPFLSPLWLGLSPDRFKPDTLGDLGREPYTTEAVLTDGGVYDNLGLETAWKRFDTILVSDGGRRMAAEEDPAGDWAMHARRLIDLLQHQTSNLRRKQVVASFERYRREGDAALERDGRKGAYWGIETDVASYPMPAGAAPVLPCPREAALAVANVPTRLAALGEADQDRIMNWGYAVCDAAIRCYYPPDQPPAPRFPFPGGLG